MVEQAAAERKDPVYLLTIGYVLALTIIAVMSLCIHGAIGQLVKEHNNPSVTISARQGMLSQRIAFYATQYVATKDPMYLQQFKDAAGLMRLSHDSLVKGDRAMNLPDRLSEDMNRIYFHLPFDLDNKMKDFITRAEAFAEIPPEEITKENTHYKYILESAKGTLVSALDAATTQYEAESEERIARLQSTQKIALFVIFATLLGEAVLIFKPLVTRVHNYAERLKRMANTDGLTGVDNSRSFMQKCIKEMKRAKRHDKPLCIAVLDIDHFKAVNDRYGHLVGDEVLKNFAQFVQRSMRLEDEFGRIGGEEFAVLLPHTPLDGAKLVAERIRNIVEISPIRYGDQNEEIFITVSIGVAEINPNEPDCEQALDAADKALYKAKERGRNRVMVSDYYNSAGNIVKLEQGVKA